MEEASAGRPRRAATANVKYDVEKVSGLGEEDHGSRSKRIQKANGKGGSHKRQRVSGDSLQLVGSQTGKLGQYFHTSDKASAISAMTSAAIGSKGKVQKKAKKNARRSGRVSGHRKSYAEQSSTETEESSASDVSESASPSESEEESISDRRTPRRTRQAPDRLSAETLRTSGFKRGRGRKTRRAGKATRRRRVVSSDSSDDTEESSDGAEGDAGEDKQSEEGEGGVQYRIQHILSVKKLTPAEWREVTRDMNTHELTRGSVWEAPDAEYFSNSPIPIEKFLIKWQHASYLHVSWELEDDLLTFVGTSAKAAFKKYRERSYYNVDLFDDILSKEYFPPSFLTVERIMDVDCDETSISTVDWADSVVPTLSAPTSSVSGNAAASPAQDHAMTMEVVESEEAVPTPHNEKTYLHGTSNCFITVKWEGLSYHDCSFENVHDLMKRDIDYEAPMRAFYRREQGEPTSRLRSTPGMSSLKRTLAPELKSDQATIPTMSGGTKHFR